MKNWLKLYNIIILMVVVCQAQTVPDLIYFNDLIVDPAKREFLLRSIVGRFGKSDMTEELFPDRPNLAAPRYSKAYLDNTIHFLSKVNASQNNHLGEYLSEKEIFQPFQVFSDGKIKQIDSETLDKWREIPIFLTQIIDDDSLKISDLEELNKSYIKNRSEILIKKMQLILLKESILSLDFKYFLSDKNLSLYDKKNIFEYLLSKSILLSKKFNLPGKVVDTFPALAMQKGLKKIPDEKKGILIAPMSRFEAIFKGVGPGECVRGSCHRYSDALMKDSFFLKILKDGVEIGYISIYKAKETKANMDVWFIESIQAPMLSDAKNQTLYVRGIIRELQKRAFENKALLAIAQVSFNSYNFKEVVAEMSSLPEILNGFKGQISFRHPVDNENVNAIANYFATATDNSIKEASGYTSNQLVNGFSFNKGNVFILAPNEELSREQMFSYSHLLNGKMPERGNFKSIENYLDFISTVYPDVTGLKISLKVIKDESLLASNLLAKYVFKETPAELINSDFDLHYKYVDYQIQNVRHSFKRAQSLKNELFLKARNASDILKILELGDVDRDLFAKFLLQILDEIETKADPSFDWLKLFKVSLKSMRDDLEDYKLSRMVARHLKDINEYMIFIKIMTHDIDGYGMVKDKDMQGRIISESCEKYLNTLGSTNEKIEFLDYILKKMNDKYDLILRKKFITKNFDFDVISKMSTIANVENGTDYFKREMAKFNYKLISSKISEISNEEQILLWEKNRSQILLRAEDKELLSHLMQQRKAEIRYELFKRSRMQVCSKYYH